MAVQETPDREAHLGTAAAARGQDQRGEATGPPGLGDCFVVVNSRGHCWDGESWIEDWCRAVQFRRPDPAYELCEQAAKEAETLTGVPSAVCYLPPGTPASLALAAFPDLSQVDLRDLARKPEVC